MKILSGNFALVLLLASVAQTQTGSSERHFIFHYAFTVRNMK